MNWLDNIARFGICFIIAMFCNKMGMGIVGTLITCFISMLVIDLTITENKDE